MHRYWLTLRQKKSRQLWKKISARRCLELRSAPCRFLLGDLPTTQLCGLHMAERERELSRLKMGLAHIWKKSDKTQQQKRLALSVNRLVLTSVKFRTCVFTQPC